jgi:hypothetical protein
MAKKKSSLLQMFRQQSPRNLVIMALFGGALWVSAMYTGAIGGGIGFSQSSADDGALVARSSGSPAMSCTTSADCGAGNICTAGTCGSVFSCPAFVHQTWRPNDPVIPRGSKLQAKNPEYLSVVPVSSGLFTRKMGAVRFQGGPMGEHTYERVLLHKFDKLRKVWGGHIEVNFKNFVDLNVTAPPVLAFIGGYTDPQWPASVPNAWLRDFVVNTHGNEAGTNGGKRYFGMTAYYHNSLATGGSQYPPILPFSEKGWPDRFIPLEWYFTPEKNLFARFDGGEWYQVHTNTGIGDQFTTFRGFATGWVSSYLDSSIDIRRISLYDDACLQPKLKKATPLPGRGR